MNIRIKVTQPEAIPTKGFKWDAGWDLKSINKTFTINPGEKVKVHTGMHIEVPVRNMGLILPRSGLGSKFEIGLANTAGVIDSDYRGEVLVNLVNKGKEKVTIKQFDRFCQLVIVPVNMSTLRVVDQLSDTRRGGDGFGSTGLQAVDKLGQEDYDEIEEILDWTHEQLQQLG